jgi:hypothetical protein
MQMGKDYRGDVRGRQTDSVECDGERKGLRVIPLVNRSIA